MTDNVGQLIIIKTIHKCSKFGLSENNTGQLSNFRELVYFLFQHISILFPEIKISYWVISNQINISILILVRNLVSMNLDLTSILVTFI